MDQVLDIDGLVDGLIDREGRYVNNPADKGGPTCFGITQAVARANGYAGPMQQLPREEAAAIYRRLYWLRPRLDEVAKRSARIAAELFDTGVNMGPAVAVTFMQRALTALNRNGTDYPDLTPDGRVGPATLAALDAFLKLRGANGGETVLLRALEALQGERYLRLAERRPAKEAFFTGGWRTVLVCWAKVAKNGARSGDISDLKEGRLTVKPLPPPATFAEGQRYIYGLLASAAGMFCGAAAGFMVALLMWGGWSPAEEHGIVRIFGWSLGGFIVAMIVVIVGLLAGGPVGRLKMTASRDGASIEADCA